MGCDVSGSEYAVLTTGTLVDKYTCPLLLSAGGTSMIRTRAAVVAVALTTVFAAATGTGQAATATVRSLIPWYEQTVFALAPDRSYVAEWNGPGAGWTIIGGPAYLVLAAGD
jgi:hypothetical protein